MKFSFAAICSRLAALALMSGLAPMLSAKPYVCMETNVGEFCVEMLPEAAPGTVANFLRYVADQDYANSMIHRSVPGFVIQGGGYYIYDNIIGPIAIDPPITNEYNQPNLRGTIAMARLSGQANSATSQWFINLGNNTDLDTTPEGGYTVFGRVVKGMDVVDAIAGLPRFNLGGGFETTPADAVAGSSQITYSQLIRVTRAYQTDTNPVLLPYQCSLTSPGDTLTEFCGTTVTFPVLVNGVLYEGTLTYIPGRAGLVFSVDTSKLQPLTDTGQARATFAAGVLTIPSVRTGASAYNDVRLTLTSSNPIELTVTGFTPR